LVTVSSRQNSNDSKTKVDLRLHGGRDRISIRCKPELKEAFSEFCRANGLSTCHIFEALVSAYLTGMKQKVDWVSQSPTIELTVVRDVKRVRRYVREPDGGRDVFIEDDGDATHCAVCGGLPTYEAGSWIDRFHYVRTWLCQTHFDRKQWMAEGKSWRFSGSNH
jgi:hypothetical protein